MENINLVKMTGRIVKIVERNNTAITVIALNTAVITRNGAKPDVNYPKVVWFNKTESIDGKVKLYDRVDITAEVQTNKRIVNGKKVYNQSIIGKTISVATNVAEAKMGKNSISTEYIGLDKNEVTLTGVIVNKYVPEGRNNMCILTVKTVNGFYSQFPALICFNKISDFVKENANIDDEVCIAGHIGTDKKEINGKVKYFENVICDSVSISPKE